MTSAHVIAKNPNPAPSTEGRALLTVADVRKLKEDLEADEQLLAELPARVEQKRKRYEAALYFVDTTALDEIFEERVIAAETPAASLVLTNPEDRNFRASRDGELTWTGAIMKVLDGATRGMAHHEIQSAVRSENHHLVETKPYYNAMSKLDKRGTVVKGGALFYAASNYERLVSAAEPVVIDKANISGKQLKDHTSAWFIYRTLNDSPAPLTASQIKDKLREEEGVTPKLTTSNNFIFNILKSLLNDGWIEKDEETKTYFVASEQVKPRGNGAS